jgi:hypothetical protein
MSPTVRRAVFLIAGAVLAGLLVWGFSGLPRFGGERSPSGCTASCPCDNTSAPTTPSSDRTSGAPAEASPGSPAPCS